MATQSGSTEQNEKRRKIMFATLFRAEEALDDYDTSVRTLEEMISEKETYIGSLKAAVEEKDRYIKSLEAALDEKENI